MSAAKKVYRIRPFKVGKTKTTDVFSVDNPYEIARSPVAAARRLMVIAGYDRNSSFVIKSYTYSQDKKEATRFMIFYIRPKVFDASTLGMLLLGKEILDRELIGFYDVCDDYESALPAVTHNITDNRELM